MQWCNHFTDHWKKFSTAGCNHYWSPCGKSYQYPCVVEKGETAVDIFTCGDCLPKIGCDIIIEQIQCDRHTLQLIKR